VTGRLRIAGTALATVAALALPGSRALAEHIPPGEPGSKDIHFTNFEMIPLPDPDSMIAAQQQDLKTSFSFCDKDTRVPPIPSGEAPQWGDGLLCTERQRAEDVRNLKVSSAAGQLGSSIATDIFCENADYVADNCPAGSIVGRSDTYVQVQGGLLGGVAGGGAVVCICDQPVYNVRPQGAEFGRLGNINSLDKPTAPPGASHNTYLPSLFSVRTSTDYGLDNVTLDLPTHGVTGFDGPNTLTPIKVRRVDLTLFGKVDQGTADPSDDKAFTTSPTNCKKHTVSMTVNAYAEPDPADSDNPGNIEVDPGQVTRQNTIQAKDCGNVPFDPTVGLAIDNQTAGRPARYEVDLNIPPAPALGRRNAHVMETTTVMPPGARLNPAAAQHLDGCTDAQFGKGNDNAVQCPPASKIGEIVIHSNEIDGDPKTDEARTEEDPPEPLTGDVYFAKPTPTKPWRIFAVADGGGLRQKLVGESTIDEQTGQVTTVFADDPDTAANENLPELPFKQTKVSLRGGNDSIFLNPPSCGSSEIKLTARPWSASRTVDGEDIVVTDQDKTDTETLTTTGCGASVPFTPSISASAGNTQAGGDPNLGLEIAVPDHQQDLRSLNISLPPGLVGRLAGIPLCSAADANAGNCPQDSRVSKVTATIGTSVASSIDFPGSAYLAEPIAPGDPASLAIVTPAKSGPIDLGKEVIRTRVRLRSSDGGIDLITDDIPTIFEGIPTPVRKITIEVDRKGFMRNPTGCEPRTIQATFGGDAPYGPDADATASAIYQASACSALPFSPKLEFFTGGKGVTGNEQHPPLRSVLTLDDGQAAIARTVVTLPDVLRPDVNNINKSICQQAQFDVGQCPASSRVGSASATTPLLSHPLSAGVYLLQSPGNVLPKLAMRLQGETTFDLVGQTSIVEQVRTMTDFSNTPDVPITRFELSVDGGKDGILKTRGSLCSGSPAADVTFTAHSGAVVARKTPLNVAGCARVKIRKTTLRRKGNTVAVPVECEMGDCAGRISLVGRSVTVSKKKKKKRKKKARQVRLGSKAFSLAEGESGIVKIRLTKSGRKLVRRKRSLRVTATAAVSDVEFSQTMQLRSRKKAKRRRARRSSKPAATRVTLAATPRTFSF
jgi:hypothetical protein